MISSFIFEPQAAKATPIGRGVLLGMRPPPRLAHLIEGIWFWQADAPPGLKERLLPTGTQYLAIDLQQPCLPAVFAGVHTSWLVADSPRRCMGVHFRPGAGHVFLDGSAAELTDRAVPLEMLWGRDTGRLRERLHDAATPWAKLNVLTNALIARQRDDRRAPAVARALRLIDHHAHVRIREVARDADLSRQRFMRMFRDTVGVTPKRYCRIRRFQQALHRIRHRPEAWADIALRCGYADQAHLVREFRALAGVTPTTYRRVHESRKQMFKIVDVELATIDG